MRFQTNKIIPHQDPEIVLNALESCLRETSLDVVRDGAEIVLHGLGPSPRAINPRDTTILRVEAEDTQTIIKADVSFQASCLLGETRQDDVVHSKLDSVLEKMKVEIGVEQRHNSPLPPPPAAPSAYRAFEEATSPSHSPEGVLPSTSALPPSVFEPVSQHELQLPAIPPCIAESKPTYFDLFQSTSVTYLVPLFAIFGLVALTLGSYLVWRHNSRDAKPLPMESQRSAQKTIPPLPSQLGVSDPRAWLENWVAAERTRDPVAQAAFYTHPVDNYLGRRNVSYDQILWDKDKAIRNRNGLWTVKLEDIAITRNNHAAATVRLVKHYIVQTEPGQISERFVWSRLRLKRIDGQWKITSEEALIHPPAAE